MVYIVMFNHQLNHLPLWRVRSIATKPQPGTKMQPGTQPQDWATFHTTLYFVQSTWNAWKPRCRLLFSKGERPTTYLLWDRNPWLIEWLMKRILARKRNCLWGSFRHAGRTSHWFRDNIMTILEHHPVPFLIVNMIFHSGDRRELTMKKVLCIKLSNTGESSPSFAARCMEWVRI